MVKKKNFLTTKLYIAVLNNNHDRRQRTLSFFFFKLGNINLGNADSRCLKMKESKNRTQSSSAQYKKNSPKKQ